MQLLFFKSSLEELAESKTLVYNDTTYYNLIPIHWTIIYIDYIGQLNHILKCQFIK